MDLNHDSAETLPEALLKTRERMSSKIDVPNNLTFEGAFDLCEQLKAYWHTRGYPEASFWVAQVKDVPVTVDIGKRSSFCVRSNLVNGMPPRCAAPRI